jgi:hypothetical protein
MRSKWPAVQGRGWGIWFRSREAYALLTIEPRLRRIKGYRHLSLLRMALQAERRRAETTENTHGA